MRLAAAAFFHAALRNYNNGDFIHHTIGRIINITSTICGGGKVTTEVKLPCSPLQHPTAAAAAGLF
jgi:hypothetical protein